LLMMEEYLLRIPLDLRYSSCAVQSKMTTSANGDPPEEEPLFKAVTDAINEDDVHHALKDNICDVLNSVLSCTYSRAPGVPDFNCFRNETLILVVEAKRNCVLESMGNQTLSEFYKKDKKAKTIVQQIYNYMTGNELNSSASPLVLKAWAYLVQRAEKDHYSPNTLLINVKNESQSGNQSQDTTTTHRYSLRDRTSSKSTSSKTS
ncbi:4000_t:CDS:2, partial [Paraglomus occultum]